MSKPGSLVSSSYAVPDSVAQQGTVLDERSTITHTPWLLQQQLCQAAFDSACDGMMIIGGCHEIVAFNEAAVKLTGKPKDDAIGKVCWQVCPCTQFGSVGHEGPPCTFRDRVRHSNPNEQRACTAKPDGRPTLFVSHIPLPPLWGEDGYQLVVIHQAFDSEEKTCMIEDAIAAASHDMLSPINLIRGYAVTLLQIGDDFTESQKQRYLCAIETAAIRATRSIRTFLDLPKMNADSLHLDAAPTSLVKLVREVVTEIQRQSPYHVIRLSSRRNMPSVTIDREKIRQVMINLLDNAIKYSPDGGNITVRIKDSGSTDVVKPTSDSESLMVEIIDSGIGIPESEVELVFEKFYRVDNTLTRSTQGMGFGLYLCKLVVEAHGGQIWATSRGSERGSIFRFTLPVVHSCLGSQMASATPDSAQEDANTSS